MLKTSVRVGFALRPHGHAPTYRDGKPIPVANSARYLGLHLYCKLNWHEHIKRKRKMLDLQLTKFNSLIRLESQISLTNKRLIYISIYRPSCSYGVEIWGTAAKTNREILERFQNRYTSAITGAPWSVSNNQLWEDLVTEPVRSFAREPNVIYIGFTHTRKLK